jgi:hypothetical protein
VSEPPDDWAALLAFALTGEWLTLPAREDPVTPPDPGRFLAGLAEIGWTGKRLAQAAAEPRVLPVARVRVLGPARFAAVLGELRARVLSREGEVRRASARQLTSDEERLSAERPPHWG